VSLSVFFSFLVLMPVTGLSLFYLNGILEDVISITQVDARIAKAARSIRDNLKDAAGTELAFVLFRENSYLEQNRRSMDEIRRTTLEGLSHLGSPDSGFSRVAGLASQYEVTMTRLADLYAAPAVSAQPLGDFEKALSRLEAHLRSLRDQAEEEKDPSARRRFFEEMRKTADSISQELLESAQEESPDRARLLDETSRIRERIDAIAEGIQNRALAHVEAHRNHVVSLSNRAQRNLLTTIVLTGIVGIYLVLFLPSRVVRSLRRITHVLQQAERGDLDVAMLETGSDEVGNLAGHLNRLLNQARTFDELKTERMLRAERRLGILVENLEEGILLVDDEMNPVFVSRKARQLLDARPEGADDARIAGILSAEEFAGLLRLTIDSQAAPDPRVINLDVGASSPRRLRIWTDPIPGANGEVKEILLVIRKAA
jgi:HAMP domain-containing protein